jgi:hypothetical protein
MPIFMRPFGLDQIRPLHTPSGDRATSAVTTTCGNACLATIVSPTRIASSNRVVPPNPDVSSTRANRPKLSDKATQTRPIKRRAPAAPPPKTETAINRIPPIPAKRKINTLTAENLPSSAPASELAPTSEFAPASELAFASDRSDQPPPYSSRTGPAAHCSNGDLTTMSVTLSITTPPR